MSVGRGAAFVAAGLIMVGGAAAAGGEIAKAWQEVLALDRGPSGDFGSREEARRLTLSHLERQEAVLGRFLDLHSSSPQALDARLRLARVYLVQGDLQDDPALIGKAFRSLSELRADPRLPEDRKPDVAFAELSLRMQWAQRDLDRERDGLVAGAKEFRKEFPEDRRVAPLFAELAGIFQDRPAEQKGLLEIAAPVARDEGLKLQIADDLRRIAMLGKRVDMEFTAMDGRKIDLRDFRGKVVAICFFADLSAPSLISVAKVEELNRNFPAHSLQCLGVSLDSSAEQAQKTLRQFDVKWPVACDGRGWESPLVRQLGINALPTVWILDRRGRLRVLNAAEDPTGPVQALIRER